MTMKTSEIKTSKANKPHICDWCNETINKNEHYSHWFCYGENITVKMHPECEEAMCIADLSDGFLPPRGTYRRGCWCGENKEFCKCNIKVGESCCICGKTNCVHVCGGEIKINKQVIGELPCIPNYPPADKIANLITNKKEA